MSWEDALEAVVVATRHERYRWLCSDANPDAARRDGYRRSVVAMATGEAPDPAHPRRPVASARRLLGLAEACPWRTKEPGCCTGYLAWCAVARSGRVTQLDCIECVGLADMPHPSDSRAETRE